MKKLKVLGSLLCMSVLCCMGLMTDVNARAEVFDISERSTTHTYKGVNHYFVTTGTVTVVSGRHSLSNVSSVWHSNGTGQYAVKNGTISMVKSEPTYRIYHGESKITVSGVTDTATISCVLNF